MSDSLLIKIAAVRRKEQAVGAGTALALGTAYLIAALSIGMLMDWLVDLPRPIRAILLVIDIAVLGWLVTRLALRRLFFPSDDETLALIVERDAPRFEGRLISSVQLSRAGAISGGTSKSLVVAMIQQALAIAEDVNFTAAIKAKELAKQSALACSLLLIAAVLFASTSSASVPLLQRAFLMPVPIPRKTQVVPISTDKTIAVGDDVTIEALARGIKPSSGKVSLRYASGATQDITLNLVAGKNDDFSAVVSNVQEPLKYTVYLGDNHGQTYSVITTIRPAVAGIKCWQVFPAYTHLPPMPRMPGDLGQLLRGSSLILSVDANKPLKATASGDVPFNRVHLSGVDSTDAPLIVNPATSQTFDHQRANAASDLQGVLLPDRTSGLSIFLVDENGIESKDPAVYPISLVEKIKPTIKVLVPKETEVLALPTDTISIEYTAHDDFALGSLSLHYKREGDPSEHVVDMHLVGTPVDANGTFDWSMTSLKVPPAVAPPAPPVGDAATGAAAPPPPDAVVCECWLRATDTDNFSNADHQPNFGDSDHFQVRIATQEEIDTHLHELQHTAVGVIGNITTEQQQANDEFTHKVLESPTTQPKDKP